MPYPPYMIVAIPWVLGGIAVWLVLSVLIDRSNAQREGLAAVPLAEIALVLGIAAVGALLAPPLHRLAVGIALAGMGIAACGDVRHRYLWEELSLPTLLAVLATGAYSAIAQRTLEGTVLLGGIALAIYFVGQLAHRESGFGDVVPTAIIGAALGPLYGVGAFAISCAVFAIAALLAGKRFGVALPFGPAILLALFIGAAGSSWVTFASGR